MKSLSEGLPLVICEAVSLDLPDVQGVFHSPSMQRLLQMVERVARHNAAVLIIGETGTGKELIARAVHYNSLRASEPWVDVNCGALPEHLVESELFGYEKGAFSGAESSKPGFFEMANRGTLFLDEVGELDQKLQVKLLRVLDGTPYYRLGGTKKVAVDARLVAATNQDLEDLVQKGRFRADLYHRLSQFQLRVPPLRDRREDISILAEHFLEINLPGVRLSDEALAMLEAWHWPGNVRELRNTMVRAAALCSQNTVGICDLPPEIAAFQPDFRAQNGSKVHGFLHENASKLAFFAPENTQSVVPESGLRHLKRQKILEALARHDGHQGHAALELGISRRTLSRQLKSMREQNGERPQHRSAALGTMSERQQNYFRSNTAIEVTATTPEGLEFRTQSSNISLGGLALNHVPPEAQNSTSLLLRFVLPGITSEVEATCSIAWCSKEGIAGIRFVHLEEASYTHLKRWIVQKQMEEGWSAS